MTLIHGRRGVVAAALIGALLGGCAMAASPTSAPAAAAAEPSLPPAAVDHHLHIQGPEVTAVLREMAQRTPTMFSMLSPNILETRTARDALEALDAAGIREGVLLSEGYMFASPFAKALPADIDRLTRLENEYNVAAALNSGGRLHAFVGVNPLAENAVSELRHWAGRDGVTGVKLQLGNSGFDPRSATHLARLGALFEAAREARLPLVVHLRSIPDYSPADVQRFIDEVLPKAGDIPIQIAHAGGFGGLDEATLGALQTWAVAIRRQAPGTENLVFDLGLVIVSDKTDAEQARRLVAAIRAIGVERFVIGSDWPSVYTPDVHNRLLQSQLPLTRAEWKIILANRAPYLR
jgi:predicted TIM-barrel fold metal-dependent hydrolase